MATFVLVHGSWAGGVVWRQLAPRLRKAGHVVYAPTLTGIGERKHLLNREIDLDTHIQDVIGVIDDEDLSDIVLVGHSYGGMVISGVADRVPEKVASLVYLDAFVPENGQSCQSLLPPDRRWTTVPGEDWLVAPIPPGGFGLKRPEVIALWEGKSGPHPLATLTQPVQLTGGIGRITNKMYILATDPARYTPRSPARRIDANDRRRSRAPAAQIGGKMAKMPIWLSPSATLSGSRAFAMPQARIRVVK
jgi:pimeloyl-ACP methyl ester carboxylesterase